MKRGVNDRRELPFDLSIRTSSQLSWPFDSGRHFTDD